MRFAFTGGVHWLMKVLQMFERKMKSSVSLCLVFECVSVFWPHWHGSVENRFEEDLKVG
jgi:hypothetical protein